MRSPIALLYHRRGAGSSSLGSADRPLAGLDPSADRSTIKVDGTDLVFVTARIADAAGVTAPHAHNPVRFTVEGPGKLIASDNGHPTNFELFQASERKAFSGYVAAIVRPVAPPPPGGRLGPPRRDLRYVAGDLPRAASASAGESLRTLRTRQRLELAPLAEGTMSSAGLPEQIRSLPRETIPMFIA